MSRAEHPTALDLRAVSRKGRLPSNFALALLLAQGFQVIEEALVNVVTPATAGPGPLPHPELQYPPRLW